MSKPLDLVELNHKAKEKAGLIVKVRFLADKHHKIKSYTDYLNTIKEFQQLGIKKVANTLLKNISSELEDKHIEIAGLDKELIKLRGQ